MESSGEGCWQLCRHSLASVDWIGNIHIGFRGHDSTIGDVVEVWRRIFQWVRHFGRLRSSPSASFPPPYDVVRCLWYLLQAPGIFAILIWGIGIDVCHGVWEVGGDGKKNLSTSQYLSNEWPWTWPLTKNLTPNHKIDIRNSYLRSKLYGKHVLKMIVRQIIVKLYFHRRQRQPSWINAN